MVSLRQVKESFLGRAKVIATPGLSEIKAMLKDFSSTHPISYKRLYSEKVMERGTCSPKRALELIAAVESGSRPIEPFSATTEIYAQRKRGGNRKFYVDAMKYYTPLDCPTTVVSLVFVK